MPLSYLQTFRLFAFLILFLSSCLSNSVESAQPKGEPEKFVVGPSAVLMPQGFFLLIRKGRKLGAIRFTSLEPGKKQFTGKASYESYFQRDGSMSLHSANVRKRKGTINIKSLKGIGRFAFQLGNDKVNVGDWLFGASYPPLLDMWPYRGEQKDYGYEFAATSAQRVEEIDSSDPRLRWFRYDANSRVDLAVSELPK